MSFSDDLAAALADMPKGRIEPTGPLYEETFEILPDDRMRMNGLRDVRTGEVVPRDCGICLQDMMPPGEAWLSCPNDKSMCIDCCVCCG